MPNSGKVNGIALAGAGIGIVFLYSGITGKSVLASIQYLISNPKGLSTVPRDPNLMIAGSSGAGTATGTGINAPVPSGSLSQNQAIGKLLAAPYGWSTGNEWNSLVDLWNQESGWSNTAKNPASGAYGIAQALPPTKYPFPGQETGGSSATVQIAWGLSYISSRYGSPSAAWAHERQFNWY